MVKILFKIALRNVVRRKLQSYLLGFMIAFTTFLLFLMTGLQTGGYKLMEDSYTKIYHGDLQIQNKLFKNLEDDFNKLITEQEGNNIEKVINGYNATKVNYSKRIESFAIAEANNKNHAFAFVGISPLQEQNVSLVSKNIIKGNYLTQNNQGEDKEIIVGKDIADFLKLQIGSEIILMTQDIYDSAVIDVFKVKGIFAIGDQNVDSKAFVDIDYFYDNIVYSKSFSNFAIKLVNSQKRDDFISYLNSNIDYAKIVHWSDLLPEIKQSIELDRISSLIFYVILVAIVGLIILNSITLSTIKRFNEFGVLSSLGLPSKYFKYLLLFENVILATIFISIGSFFGMLVLYYLAQVGLPIPGKEVSDGMGFALLSSRVYPEIYNSFLLVGPSMVFLFCVLSCIPSLIKISKLKPVEAIYY